MTIGRMIRDDTMPEAVVCMYTMMGPNCYNGRHPFDRITFAPDKDSVGQCRQCGEPIWETIGSHLAFNTSPIYDFKEPGD